MKRFPIFCGRGGYWAFFATCFFVLVAAGSPLRASILGTVEGHAYLNNAPAKGARVELLLLGKVHASTVTDAAGKFRFEGVCFGVYDLKGSLGKAVASVKEVKVRLQQTTFVDLFLVDPAAPKPLPLVEPVVVEELEKEEWISISSDESYGDIMMDAAPAYESVEEPAPAEAYIIIGGDPLPLDREGYDHFAENRFHEAFRTPLSTFAIDVDEASYTNCRRMLMQEQRMPVAAAVRIEEFVNYFDYDYPQPKDEHPFSITTELSECPWAAGHQLVHIGLQGKKLVNSELPPANLVFLIDVSGSMDVYNKLPLVKQGLEMLVGQLRPQDQVAIVVYAGAAGLVLPSTSGDQALRIKEAIQRLNAGGSTAGGAGILLAYKTAKENFKPKGNNRVILCTDGDFNVGTSSDGELVALIEKERESGVFLSVMGFGTGNYQDAKMEKLADNGNGNFSYIDQVLEAKKVFVNEVGGTLTTIAKDVKIQVEFNPAQVKSYRLIGYENRRLENEDFENDLKDAGELGAGHTVTALYEVVPVSSVGAGMGGNSAKDGGKLRYQTAALSPVAGSGELLTVKFRYKAPDGDASLLIEEQVGARVVPLARSSENFRFSAAVAGFAMLLRGSDFAGTATFAMVRELAKGALGADAGGYRAEFLRLVETAEVLAGAQAAAR